MEIWVELQDMGRFKWAEELASYIEFTPVELSTGHYVRQERISQCRNNRERTSLLEASWILIQKDYRLRKRYDPSNLGQRIPKNHLRLPRPMNQRHEDLLPYPQELPHRLLHLGVFPA